MTITKFGHSCFLVEEKGVRFLFDPGTFSKGQNDLMNIDAILVTHEHMDHLDMDSVKAIMTKNPQAIIYTNSSVQKILGEAGIASTVVMHGESVEVKGVSLEGVGKDHAIMFTGRKPDQNVGFMVGERLFFPGDALTIPAKPVEILALPAAAPWSKMSEIMDYALAVKPQHAFPVHEAILANPSMMYGFMGKALEDAGIDFRPLAPDGITTFEDIA